MDNRKRRVAEYRWGFTCEEYPTRLYDPALLIQEILRLEAKAEAMPGYAAGSFKVDIRYTTEGKHYEPVPFPCVVFRALEDDEKLRERLNLERAHRENDEREYEYLRQKLGKPK